MPFSSRRGWDPSWRHALFAFGDVDVGKTGKIFLKLTHTLGNKLVGFGLALHRLALPHSRHIAGAGYVLLAIILRTLAGALCTLCGCGTQMGV